MPSTHDEAFREIQLSGKQLVFLFMAATVVSVVIFLCGVLVGRGVRTARGLPESGDASGLAAADVEPGRAVPAAAAERGASDAPASGSEKLSYPERLGAAEPAAEQLRNAEAPPPAAETEPVPTPAASIPAPAVAESKPAAPPAANRSKAAAPAMPTEPAGSGFSIQVAAIGERDEADSIVTRLVGKGYPAYVVAPAKGAPGVFRVRVGKFKDRAEASATAARLQKEEQFKPWVLR